MIDISSPQNEHFRRWQDLETAKGIKKHNEFFLMGERLIQEFLENPKFKVKGEIICEGLEPLTPKIKSLQQAKRVPVFKLPKNLFNQIDFVGTHFNLLVLELPEIPVFDPKDHPQKGLELLAPLGDPSNLGALVRSAVAFGASAIVLTQDSATPFHPKAIKASAGAVLGANVVRSPMKVSELVEGLSDIYALDMRGTDISQFKRPAFMRLLVGEEGPGLPSNLRAHRLFIATEGVESLNATVAASIALYQLAQLKN